MSMYWLNATSFCPVDSGFLEKTGEIRFDVYTCPRCGNRFVMLAGTQGRTSAPISDGFIQPKEIHQCGKKKEAFETKVVLTMTIPRSA